MEKEVNTPQRKKHASQITRVAEAWDFTFPVKEKQPPSSQTRKLPKFFDNWWWQWIQMQPLMPEIVPQMGVEPETLMLLAQVWMKQTALFFSPLLTFWCFSPLTLPPTSTTKSGIWTLQPSGIVCVNPFQVICEMFERIVREVVTITVGNIY